MSTTAIPLPITYAEPSARTRSQSEPHARPAALPLVPMIDAHVHLDMVDAASSAAAFLDCPGLRGVITVSRNLESCRRNRELHRAQPHAVFPAYGYHPEQAPPSPEELAALLSWMELNRDTMIAVGEVGLPYYLRAEAAARGEPFDSAPYLTLLEQFVVKAAEWDLPIVLHAVYDDAEPTLDLLERHRVRRAHFHWFKGPDSAVRRMIERGYYISVTPDLVYEPEIQALARIYPLELIMIETDGPWPFEGPFAGEETHPGMMAHTLQRLADLKGRSYEETARCVYENTIRFYRLADRIGTA
jgi:TatD DNase family protein